MTSLKKALAAGVDGLEVDIHLSQDGIPILFHDLRLEPMTAARGLIEDRPAAGVLGLPYQGGFPYDLFQREKVAAFEDLLRHIQAYPEKPYLHLDLRQEGLARPDYYAYTLLALLRRYQYPMQKVTLISPEAKLLQAFRQSEPRATCLLDSQGDFEAVLSEVLRCGLPGLVMNAADMNPERMRRVRQHRLQIVLFGPKAPRSIYKALLLGPDALQVNNVTVLVGMVKRD
jgi:glycerophosphoryl diester phosphodiesterase